MKAIEIDAGDGCVAPTAETIADASYPFSRSLYIYVNTANAADNPAVASFVDLYLSREGLADGHRLPATCRCPTTASPPPRTRGRVADGCTVLAVAGRPPPERPAAAIFDR